MIIKQHELVGQRLRVTWMSGDVSESKVFGIDFVAVEPSPWITLENSEGFFAEGDENVTAIELLEESA